MAKNSKAGIGLTSLFGAIPNTSNPLSDGDLTLNASYSGDRATKVTAKAGQGNGLTRFDHRSGRWPSVLPTASLPCVAKWMTLNTGDELVRIAGLVRADDIATDNTVSSTRIADARITYSGTGSFADASQPGWFDRFFLSPLFPF